MRPPLSGGTILITGASSGIGRELTRQLASRARALILVARRRDRLDELKQELEQKHPSLLVNIQACDLIDEAATDGMLDAVQAEVGDVDILINNAGFGDIALFEKTRWEKLDQMIRLNVLSLTRLTHRLLDGMLRRSRGGILNISSGLGLTFFPGAATYAGTKNYVTCFTEALRLELRGTGVVVSQVCPGPVRTEFYDIAGNPLDRPLPSFLFIDPDRCARIALSGFSRGKALIMPGLVMRLLVSLSRLTPRPLLRLFLRLVPIFLRRFERRSTSA
jgi:uncharacterized protein